MMIMQRCIKQYSPSWQMCSCTKNEQLERDFQFFSQKKKKSPIQLDWDCLVQTLVGFGSEAPQLTTKNGGVNVYYIDGGILHDKNERKRKVHGTLIALAGHYF